MTRVRTPAVMGLVALTCSGVGYVLEWFRQRGTCEFGDNAPDTLALSVLLIVLGGGLLGLVAVVVSLVRMMRHHVTETWGSLAVSVLAVVSIVPLFLSAGAGPGSWFQYCAT